jgi:class 3 adenylate cyclase
MAKGIVPPEAQPLDPLRAGRAAFDQHAWQEAFDLLSLADAQGELSGRDLELLVAAAFFTPRPDVIEGLRERAFKAHLDAGDPARAAYIALQIGREAGWEGRSSIASAWIRRAERLLESEPEGYAHGYLALVRSDAARARGDTGSALTLAEQAVEIGERTRDPELHAWSLSGLGSLRIAIGDAPGGIELMEEASVAAISGELSPLASGVIACTMISACRDLTDFGRASEWIQATDRYCQSQDVAGFPGVCRLHRGEVLIASGGWQRGEQEIVRATTELERYRATPVIADGHYALGDVRRLRGDLEAAEAAYRQAHAMGRTPQPGLALVRLAEGKVRAASSAIEAALEEAIGDRWARARLLSAQVEIAISAGDRERARDAADELAETVATYPSPTMTASVHVSHGRVLLADDDPAGAARELRAAIRSWREAPNPYELARTRALLAQALVAQGDDEDAGLELEAARSEFVRLGAALDEAAAARAAQAAAERRLPATQARMTFMFTDIVGSTRLAEALGDEAWEPMLGWHDRTLRSLVERSGGHVVKSTGDGIFAAFDLAQRATECAMAIQQALAEHRRTTGFALGVRIGLHAAEANRRGDDYTGMGVHVAARVAALAGPGEILATVGTLTEAGAAVAGDTREVELKGISTPVTVASIAWG